jgi:hypothetical protein
MWPAPTRRRASRAIKGWLEAGGHWLGLHGTSGGRAERVEGLRSRRTVKTEHHALLGSRFLTHPPICKIHVEVKDTDSPLTRGLGASFDVEDEPYFIELQDPGSTRILLTADYGASGVSSGTAAAIAAKFATSDSLARILPLRSVIGFFRPPGFLNEHRIPRRERCKIPAVNTLAGAGDDRGGSRADNV